jgi:transcription-repair coupling factor (superfamily II helicase)
MFSHLPQRVDRVPQFDQLKETLAHGGVAQIDGLTGAARALVLARLAQCRGGQILVITYQEEQCRRLYDDLRGFGIPDAQLFVLPATQSQWLFRDTLDYRTVGERIAALCALGSGTPCIVLSTPEGTFQRTCTPNDLIAPRITVRRGRALDMEALLRRLVDLGYEHETTVTRPGQFSHRGGIIDIFASTEENPVRLEFFGDEIESLRTFDISSQRSVQQIEQLTISPMREVPITERHLQLAIPAMRSMLQLRKQEFASLRDREGFNRIQERIDEDIARLESGVYFDGVEEYLPYLVPEYQCALDFLQQTVENSARTEPMVVVDEPGQGRLHWDRLRTELEHAREPRFKRGELLTGAEPETAAVSRWDGLHQERACLVLSHLPRPYPEFPAELRIGVSAGLLESYRHRLPALAEEIRVWLSNGGECLVAADQPHRVREILVEQNVPTAPEGDPLQPGAVHIVEGRLRQGFKFAEAGLFLLTDAEMFGAARPVSGKKRAQGGIAISTILDLRENDYVVHVHHGIGIYRGLVKRQVEGADRDFLYVQYAGADALYVPADQIDRIQRYVGGDGNPPVINKLGGSEWQKTTRKVKEQARRMAGELIRLYAARESSQRVGLGEDTPWQAEMEDAFPYTPTPSQARAIADVKQDLMGPRPMDRLVCGDVGYGKTEVAVRAAFKVTEAGRQVAVLCPTTVLAAQHHTTFMERFAAYPTRIELLSRYRDKKQQRETIEALKLGEVDIVVGTHRLLSKDVEFKNLGLVVVDEEQRFGVAAKERLKQLRTSVDVLTLSATPIPRTLGMALSGLRDMSIIEDPPTGRLPILTYVREYNEEVIRDAILRELERGGQVYVVHNRIETIDHLANRIRKLVPDCRIGIGHGQMSEDDLEALMNAFYHGEYDILVCTTIIENGVDVSNSNTIIVNNADKLGLSQLYQLRGRVGRSNRQAYAYLLYEGHKVLSEEADRRLSAIKEFTALGSGYQVAMRDLEIRGAGNLLGAEQSGLIVSVGYDLYCKLLAQAVQELQGTEATDEALPPVDLPITAHIPSNYIPGEAERIYIYKRMAAVTSIADITALQEELEDRYGDPPREVWNALAVLRLRLRAQGMGITSIRGEQKKVTIRFDTNHRFSSTALRLLTFAFKQHKFLPDQCVMQLGSAKVMEEVEQMLDVLDKAMRNEGVGGKTI